ncbi:hypothetical protein M501DRAFT_469896 [Patellaria atrata CBS 101060]|uniref:Uncharacterized protein n=1 Tax=Patellaria atrata CBS 101060 TaxID=1346257 RepID=A0A9P4S4N5_9PEZI|nr:hypothetical protein M501DRAFT_469896 [Patellaria atrata CBS 101060]
MVHLIMTTTIAAAVQECRSLFPDHELWSSSEPSISDLAPGNPISHTQLIELSNLLKKLDCASSESSPPETSLPRTLNDLLRGSALYTPPPAPKPQKTPEYEALMSRLRATAESQTYSTLLSPSSSISQPSFSTISPTQDGEDGITYADLHRQATLVLNMVVSVLACGVAIFIAARWWDAPARVALAMGGALLVAVAETVVYWGYLRRVEEAKEREVKKAKGEVRKVVGRWEVLRV